ncbi:MAG: HAD family hydrolase [Propionibacterium sp.]|nr:HAD family hydrolase [Propionibacterium sp.]
METVSRDSADLKALILDWGGTITPWHQVDYRAQWTTFADGYGTMACSLNNLAATLLDAERTLWRRVHDDHSSGHLREIFEAVGIVQPDEDYDAATLAGIEAYRTFWEPHTFTHPAWPSVWEHLRSRGVKIAVLSNTIWPRSWHEDWFARDGVSDLLDVQVYSSDLEWAKPHPKIFEYTAEQLGLDPAECAYLGDRRYEDVFGAQRAGMQGWWFPHDGLPPDQIVEVDVTPEVTLTEPDQVIGFFA